MRLYVRTMTPLLLALHVSASTSARSVTGDTLHTLRDVDVVGVRLPLREVIGGQQLGGDELARAGSGSVADALRYLAGVQVKDYGGVGGIKTINIRSIGSQHVGICYDGIELGNAQNGQIDLGQFSLDNIQELTVYNGQRSAIFQPASDFAHGGSVYLRTRQPRFAQGKPSNVRVKAQCGASDLLRLSTLWERRLSERVSLSLNAEWMSASGKYRFRYKRLATDGTVAYDTTATRQNGDVRAERAELSLNGLLNRGHWTAKAYFYNSGRGIPGAIVNNVWRRGERQYDTNLFVQHRLQKDFGNRFSTQFLAKYAFYRTHYINNDSTQLPADNRYWQQELYLSTANAVELLPQWSVSMAYDLRWNKLNADTHRFAFPTRLSQLASIATAIDLGFLRLQGSVVGIFVNDHTRLGPSARLHKYAPAAFLSFRPFASESLRLHAFAKRSFRMPTFNDLYYTEVGNARLLPEHVNQYDLGFEYKQTLRNGWLKSVSLRADGYHNSVRDKIIAYPKGQQFRWTMLNLGRVHINGIDATASATLCPIDHFAITTRLQYTFQEARDVTDKSTPYYRDQIPYVPRHSGSVAVGLLWQGWSLDYSFIYAGNRWNAQENNAYNHMEPWYTHDLCLRRAFAIGSCEGRATLEINNLLNQQYEVIANYPMPGINARIGLELNI